MYILYIVLLSSNGIDMHIHDAGEDNEITGAISALDQGAEVDCGLVEEPVNLQTPLRAACAKVHRERKWLGVCDVSKCDPLEE